MLYDTDNELITNNYKTVPSITVTNKDPYGSSQSFYTLLVNR